MRAARWGLALALAVAAALVPARGGAQEPATFEIALEDARVRIGDDIVVRATFTNRTRDAALVPELRLARDAVTLTLVCPDAGLEDTDVTRLWGHFAQGADGPELRPRPTLRRRVAPGESLTATLRVPALVLGRVTVRASLGPPGPGRLRADALVAEVVENGPGREPAALVETSRGTFTLGLRPVPEYAAAAQFWALARAGFYDGLDVHRVVPGRLVQTGDPRGDGAGDAGWFLPSSRRTVTLRAGDVGLARGAHRDSASSQWFVSLAAGESTEIARFAVVTSGLDVVRTLRAGDSADTIRSVRVETR